MDKFDAWIDKYIDNWATCDHICTRLFGYMLMTYPTLVPRMHKWSRSKNLWYRRASAVSFVNPVKKEMYFKDVIRIATTLLHDEEDLVQKGYGWLLKEMSKVSKNYQKDVYDFVTSHADTMPRTAFRYALEKMPNNLRKKAMKL